MLLKGGDMRISQVPWKPVEHVPRSTTPVVDEDSTLCRPRRSPSALGTASANHELFPLSELSHAARVLAVYASPPWLPIVDATLATGGGASPCLDGTFTRWVSLLSFCFWISYIRGLLSARAFLAHPKSERSDHGGS